jgi:hypothetical protein
VNGRQPRRRGLATGVALALGLAVGSLSADIAPAPLAGDSERALWEFQVLLDGREIGYHRFDVQNFGETERVDIEARFEVEFLFITAYEYAHDNQETWSGDCLQQIESSTNDNGTEYAIAGEASSSGFTLARNDDAEAIDTPCLKTFAYWNRDILQADRLLNAQTGEWKPVTVESIGTTPFEVSGIPVPAEEYRLLIPDGAIRLWYQEDNGQWLGLETETKGGRILRYEPRALPRPTGKPPAASVAARADTRPELASP